MTRQHPGTLRSEVERMLEDPRSERFVEHFLDQWLALEEINFTTPDPKLYPEFDPWLQDSMLAETRGYFRKMLDENLSIDHSRWPSSRSCRRCSRAWTKPRTTMARC